MQFVEKDPKLAEPVLRALLKFWPLTNSQKEVLFIGELEEVLELTQARNSGFSSGFRLTVRARFRSSPRKCSPAAGRPCCEPLPFVTTGACCLRLVRIWHEDQLQTVHAARAPGVSVLSRSCCS